MDSITSTDDLMVEVKSCKENLLFEIIKELCNENLMLTTKLKGKVSRIVADCDLTHHSSLHKLSAADESTSTVLGFMQRTSSELTFDEQVELNQAVIKKIEDKIPTFTENLEALKQTTNNGKKTRKMQIIELQESLDDKLNMLHEQENEKTELMMEWLNHRLSEVNKFSEDSSELLTIRTRILELKSTIVHLQILQGIFTETNQSIKAYSEIHKDLKDSIKETEQCIRHFKEVIESEFK